MKVPVILAGIASLLIAGHSLAVEGACGPQSLSSTGPLTEGLSCNGVKERCLRRISEGVRVTCDSGETAISVFCEQNGSPTGSFSALISNGVIGSRTGACLWSNITDGTVVVRCKTTSALKRDASGDVYARFMRIQTVGCAASEAFTSEWKHIRRKRVLGNYCSKHAL